MHLPDSFMQANIPTHVEYIIFGLTPVSRPHVFFFSLLLRSVSFAKQRPAPLSLKMIGDNWKE